MSSSSSSSSFSSASAAALLTRAALLRRHGSPNKASSTDLESLATVSSEELDATRRALADRGLQSWQPPLPEFAPGANAGLPSVLLVAGAIPTRAAGVALVGARACDDYGRAVTRRLAEGACAWGASVISGGADGVDGEAHRGALAAGGRTVVVVAGGHDHPFPAAHRPLFEEVIASGGSVISACWPTVRPAKHRFLARNRVIAGLSDIVVVTRARARSGSLSTAKHALSLGRRLCAVPGNVGEGLSAGPHQLLARGQATAVASARDLEQALEVTTRAAGAVGLESLAPWPVSHCGDPDPFKKNSVAGGGEASLTLDLDPDALKVKNAVSGQTGLDLDTIAMRTGLATSVVVASLALLELTGDIENLPGSRYRASLPTPSRPR